MDLDNLSQNQQITVGAALAMLVIAFFPWYGAGGSVSWNGWTAGFSAVIGVLLIVAAGGMLLLESANKSPVDSPADIAFILAGLGAASIAFRLIFRLLEADRRIGMFLAVIAAGAALWGAFQNRLDNS